LTRLQGFERYFPKNDKPSDLARAITIAWYLIDDIGVDEESISNDILKGHVINRCVEIAALTPLSPNQRKPVIGRLRSSL